MSSAFTSQFQSPPKHGLTMGELYDWHNQHNPEHPLFTYPGGDGKDTRITYSQFHDAYHRAGFIMAGLAGINLNAHCDTYPVVAMLSTADTISTFTTLVGILRLGAVPFPISPRYSARVVATLMKNANARHLIVNAESNLRPLAEEAVTLLSGNKNSTPAQLHFFPEFEALYQSAWYPRIPKKHCTRFTTAIIIHSSSSSSDVPKVIPWSHRMQIQNSLVPVSHNNHKLDGAIFSCHSLELFHTLGLLFLSWAPTTGMVIATFKPSSPAILPTPELCFEGIRETQAQYALTHTKFMEKWVHDENKILHLKTLGGIVAGGKILKQSAGDILTRRGVLIGNIYGSTEGGVVSGLLPDYLGDDLWEYFQINPQCKMEFIDQGDGTYHGIVVPSERQSPSLMNTTFDGSEAYATGDLMIPHPTRKDYWKVLGRIDDSILLATGEVIHPVRPENIICSSTMVKSAQLFGHARTHLGVLVELEDEALYNLADIDEARDMLWPSVELMNDEQPSFGKIAWKMILVASPEKGFIHTPKGAPKRAQNLLLYQNEIDELYQGSTDPYLARHASSLPQPVTTTQVEQARL
ncbi:hypothetical protein AAF712_007380 [Marasmius tenuissimus]|uniref:AMP-dependent synthetase/ligase domain-containing protein n=1 Tax=Marasmius tenuissimus TaxID=585030 RepID=A0ABR2ZX22_9AGAR